MISPLQVSVPTSIQTHTLSLHDALPILAEAQREHVLAEHPGERGAVERSRAALLQHEREGSLLIRAARERDRKSTRLNSSHRCISYAVFCLKKKKNHIIITHK